MTEVPDECQEPPPCDDQRMEVMMAALMAKIDEKFEKLSREQAALIPAPAEGARSPNEHRQAVAETSTATTHHNRHHRKRKRTPSPEPAINSSDSDSDYTDHENPTEHIEARIHSKAKRSAHQSGTTAFDMGWAKLGDEVTDRLRQRILTNEYFPLRILRTDYDIDPQEDPSAPTVDRKRTVIPVDQIGEWLHLFMTYAAIRSEQFPEEGSQLMTYMDHILTMHARKGPRVWLEYDYRFRVRRERTGAPWNVFSYPIYSSVKASCKAKENSTVTSQPFRDYGTRNDRARPTRFCHYFNRGQCKKRECQYSHACSFCRKEGHSRVVCRARTASNKTQYTNTPKTA